jgi:hypothetical protein
MTPPELVRQGSPRDLPAAADVIFQTVADERLIVWARDS